GRTGEPAYLEASKTIGAFVTTLRGTTGTYRGFRGGIQDAESANPMPRPYASTEHNLDLFAAFSALQRVTEHAAWGNLAEQAFTFVDAMFETTRGCYLAGTTASPDERNELAGQLPLDTQSWSVLALGDRAPHRAEALACA